MYTGSVSTRRLRLASDIRALLGPWLTQAPPECEVLTITDVRISPDDAYVTVSVSSWKEQKKAMEWLKEFKPQLQKIVAKVSTQRVPRLRFVLDTEGEKAARLDDLLK